MEELPDLEPVRTFIPTAYAMLEEIERELLKQLEQEQHRFVKPYLPDLDVDREGWDQHQPRHFLPDPWELKWYRARARKRKLGR